MIRLRRRHPEEVADDQSHRLVVTTDPNSAAAEAYRTLRTNLLYSFVDTPPKVIVFTSAGAREGKSTTCANLAVVMAQAGKSTLLMDCDYRKPVIHKIFGLHNMRGMTDVLAGERSLEEVSYEPQNELKVLTVGPVPPNPAELLGSKRFADFLAKVRQEFDYVLVDAAPVGLVSDPAILASQGDGVVLVLDAEHTRKGAFRGAMRSLEAVGANMLGTVMNNVASSEKNYYYHHDYYGRGYQQQQ